MYRLAGARSAYSGAVCAYTGTTVHGVRSAGWTERASCTLCRQPKQRLMPMPTVDNVLGRQQSTRHALHKLSKKKIKYKKQKKYVELLEVNDKSMTETKASVNKLRADHLSKIASSSVSLHQLHQLTTTNKTGKSQSSDIDLELLRNMEIEIMKNHKSDIDFEDDHCALVFTSQEITRDSKFMNKEYLTMVRQSYDTFRKLTIRDQRLRDLNFAINEGLNQEIEMDAFLLERSENVKVTRDGTRGAHDVFREFLQEYRSTAALAPEPDVDLELSHIQSYSRSMPCIEEEDIYEAEEMVEEDLDTDLATPVPTKQPQPAANPLNVNKSKAKIKLAERKAKKKKSQQTREKSMQRTSQDLERSMKEESLNTLLAAHLHLHCSLGCVHKAHHILQHYRTRFKKSPLTQTEVRDTRIYNILLQGYADKGDYSRASELILWMREDNITMDIQTYSTIFQCVERSALIDKGDVLSQYAQQMTEKGLTLNDLLEKGKFLFDQKKYVLSAVRRLQPAFKPHYTPPDLDYVCPLLERLKLDNLPENVTPRSSEVAGMLTAKELKERSEIQLQNELKGYIEVQNVELSGDPSPSVLTFRKKLASAEAAWREAMLAAFTRNLSTLKSQSTASHSAITLYPYLTVVQPEEVVELMIGEIRRLADGSESYSPSIKALQSELGYQIYTRFQVEQYRKNGVLDKVRSLYREYCEWYAGNGDGSIPPQYNSRQVWQHLMHKHRDSVCLDYEEYAWPSSVCSNIGKFIYNILINDVKIDLNMFKTKNTKQKKMPAIYKVHRACGRLSRVEVKPHPLLSRLCRGAATPALRMRTPLAPLICPPTPWTRARRNALGAYLLTPPPLVRMPVNVVAQWNLLEAAQPSTLYPSLDSLNQLGEVPWRVNTRILDLQLQIFRSGGSKELDISQPPSALDMSEFPIGDTKTAAFRRRLAISRARSEMYSLWCDMLYKLSLANHYRDDIFWLPHNMDFRGRVYACPPHLSQLGADPSRALLKFARSEPLGKSGLRWLKLHVINLTGTMKKATLDERLAYVDSIIDKIVDSADRPLDGQRWWARSEEPWQTLACCMEIAAALRSPDPEAYRCSFPVHQDGSCNGLQHYAALGRDSAGAASVNLAALAKPQDVYTAVANKVEEMRIRDAEEGIKPAIVLESFVRRKVIKQTVMTTVYGVTRYGARLQIAKQLKDLDGFPKDQIWPCSTYLTGRTFESLREMFTSTKLIQDWFTECSKLIAGVCGESVEWVTPLGLPIVQPYHRRRNTNSGDAQAGALPEQSPLDQFLRPCMVKQKNAFPPNFIHSLDSSHMMLTSLYCRDARVHFVSVHDCFWTHPSTVDLMNKICREQFVALHSQPILEDLSRYLLQRFSYPEDYSDADGNVQTQTASKLRVNKVLQAVPPKGDFRLDNVLNSVYFFS